MAIDFEEVLPFFDVNARAAQWRAKLRIPAFTGVDPFESVMAIGDFEIRAEFWVDDEANSGIFIRPKTA